MDERPAAGGEPFIVAMPEMIDVTNAEHACDRLASVIEAGAGLVIADLSATAFCDAAGAHRLLMTASQAAARGCRLRLVIPPGALMRRVLTLLEIDHLLPVYATLAEAMQPVPSPQHPLSGFFAG